MFQQQTTTPKLEFRWTQMPTRDMPRACLRGEGGCHTRRRRRGSFFGVDTLIHF